MKHAKRTRSSSDSIPATARRGVDIVDLQSIKLQLQELRELLVELMQLNGKERAGARSGDVIFGNEKRIPLAEAVPLTWGKSAAKGKDSCDSHVGILKIWATKGLNGAILETVVSGRRWMTSREAVKRFREQTV